MRVSGSTTPGTVAPQAPLSMGFSRQEHWRGCMPSSRDLSDPGIEPASLAAAALRGRFFTAEPSGKPFSHHSSKQFFNTSRTSYNLTQLWLWLPRDCTGWQSPKRLHSSQANHKSRLSLVLWPTDGRFQLFPPCCPCCCSVMKSCLTLCDPTNCSIPGSPISHCLLEFAQIHIHCVGWYYLRLTTTVPNLGLVTLVAQLTTCRETFYLLDS